MSQNADIKNMTAGIVSDHLAVILYFTVGLLFFDPLNYCGQMHMSLRLGLGY